MPRAAPAKIFSRRTYDAVFPRRRRPSLPLPAEIEWLNDNGSGYTADETRRFAVDIGLKPLTTPVYSLQSNGMAESFVKTMKRDYMGFMPKPDAASAARNLAIAFEHYNEEHPHSGLKYRSPREFRRTLALRSGRPLPRCFHAVRRTPNDGVEARHGRAPKLNVGSLQHPGKQVLESPHRASDDDYIVVHAPTLLIICYVHAMLLSRVAFLITPLMSQI